MLLAAALFIRLYGIDLIPFTSEQVLMLSPALQFAHTGHLAPVGGLLFRPGMHPPPLVNAVLALPLKFSADPMWAAIFQCTVDALAAPLLFLTVSRAWNRQAGFAAGVLYAALPAALMNARYVANIGVVPFLCAVAMCALVEFVLSGQGIFLGLAVLAAGLAAQLHLTVGLLILPLGLVACLRWRKIDWRWLAGGAALAAIPLLPYVGYQLANGWPDLGPALGFVSAPKVTSLSALEM
ncbi:MAG TPA: glycosyltransferase family 39 protein, partial [Chloroflexota bacterium]|nr:glycosyltransferase family 39 protein [Chloroflexota bacterium]